MTSNRGGIDVGNARNSARASAVTASARLRGRAAQNGNGIADTGTGSPSRVSIGDGIVTGHVLRLARESIGATREQLAEQLEVDHDTLKSWETARRPFVAASGRTIRKVRLHLAQSGADPRLLASLDPAMEADLFLEQAARGDDPGSWVLAGTVGTRAFCDLILWPVTGVVPASLAPVAASSRPIPLLRAGERQAFFDGLREGAERARSGLLRRQAYFLASRDTRDQTRDWLTAAEDREMARRDGDGWPGDWVTRRSLAVARACQGDPTLLRQFIARDIQDDRDEAANLVYWGYWVTSGGRAASDDFMGETPPEMLPLDRLLDHLGKQLRIETPYLDLSVHTVAALVQRYPRLLGRDQATQLADRAARLLESGQVDYEPTRRDLDRIMYAAMLRREQ